MEIEHPVAGKMTMTGSQLKLSETPVTYRKTAPALGEDNEAVYGEWIGLTAEQIADYKEKGVM